MTILAIGMLVLVALAALAIQVAEPLLEPLLRRREASRTSAPVPAGRPSSPALRRPVGRVVRTR